MRSIFGFIVIVAMFVCSVEGKGFEANYDESKIPKYSLPDPLVMADGTKVVSAEQWRLQRRGEVVDLF